MLPQKFYFPARYQKLIQLATEIISCLGELNFKITDDELKNCGKNVDTIRRLFEYLLDLLIGATSPLLTAQSLLPS